MKKSVFLIIFSLLIGACAPMPTRENYIELVNTWNRVPIDKLVSSWGYPKSKFKGPNGNTVWVYYYSSSHVRPTETNTTYTTRYGRVEGNSTTTGGQTITYWCKTFFEVNEYSIIVRVSFEGNNCRSNKIVKQTPEIIGRFDDIDQFVKKKTRKGVGPK